MSDTCRICGTRFGLWIGAPMDDGLCPRTRASDICQEARDERMTMAAGIAANMQRAPLAPVDQWRAIVHLQSLGWTLDGAAAALGVPLRAARKLDKLGRLHPDMLAAIEKHGMPIAAEAAARMIVCAPTGLTGNASGDAAEWIGAAIGAERDLPRLDTAELLACVSGDALRAIDVQRGGTGKGATKTIRERLVGHAEDLRLPGSAFAAEVPELVDAEDTDAGEGFATCDGCDEPEDCKAAGKCWAESEGG